MKPNPYEPPRESKPTAKSVKRGIGVGAILLLTPFAVLIAFGASCAATIAFVESPIGGHNFILVLLICLAIFSIPPILVLIAMIWWAERVRKRDRELEKQELLNKFET